MVVGALMEVAPSPEKTLQRLIAVVGLNVLYLDLIVIQRISGAYGARWVAKSLVKAGVCRRCLVQVCVQLFQPEKIVLRSRMQ